MQEVEVQSGSIFLAGSLTLAAGTSPQPLVICIHGSGPLDRDENAPHQKLNIFNMIAEELANAGMACFRYDKRGIGKSGGDYYSASHADLVADAQAVAARFRNDKRFSHIFLLGHSEGTLIAPQVAAGRPIDGLILLAPFITPLGELLAWQGAEMQRSIDRAKGLSAWLTRQYMRWQGGVLAMNNRLVARVRQTRKPVLRQGLRKVEAAWIRELLEIRPADVFAAVRCPCLILVAGADVQCPPEDGAKIAQVIGDEATLEVIPALSHILRVVEGDAGFSGYAAQLDRPMAPIVAETVTAWLKAQLDK